MKKLVFMLSASILSLSAIASNNESVNFLNGSNNLNEQSVTNVCSEGEYIKVQGLSYSKSSKEFIQSDVNKYVGTIFLNIVRHNGEMYHQDGNMREHRIERNRSTSFAGMNVSGYSYRCETSWEILFFNF